MAGAVSPIEFQRLHGMGEALYAAAAERYGPFPLRVYAPVGAHEDLLPYLVRRLLENGANTSFVHPLLDDETPPEAVVADPIALVEAQPGPHPRIPLPRDLYGDRRNSAGVDLSIAADARELGIPCWRASRAATGGRSSAARRRRQRRGDGDQSRRSV